MTFYRHITIVPLLAIITACGGGGGGGDTAGAIIAGSVNGGNSSSGGNNSNASVTMTASKTSVVVGDPITITWSSSNASSCTASGYWSGSKSLSGSENFTMDSYGDHTFSINCSGGTASVDVTVNDEDSEGSCTNPHSSKIKEEYLGEFDIPMPQNSFGEGHFKAIGFKDYGVQWVYENYKNKTNLVNHCTKDQYIKLMYRTTLRRLKEHGVETAWVYNFGYWNDHTEETWTINHGRKHITDSQIEFIAETAKELGMKMHYAWQFLVLDDTNTMLFPFDGMAYVDRALLKRIMDTHEKHMIWEAERLQSVGASSMSADWSAMWICFCGLQNEASQEERVYLENYYMERMASIISEIKVRFDGEVFMGEGMVWNDSRVMDQIDAWTFSLPTLFFPGEEDSATVEQVEERIATYISDRYNEWTCNDGHPCGEYTTYDIPPVIWNLFAQSHKMFLSRGWYEDGFCTEGTYDGVSYEGRCMQWSIPTDFSAQAMYIEGMLRAVDKQPWFNTKGTTASTAYWLSDTLIPNSGERLGDGIEGFPNISQSVRGKPAEKIIKHWYTGEYEPYTPEYD